MDSYSLPHQPYNSSPLALPSNPAQRNNNSPHLSPAPSYSPMHRPDASPIQHQQQQHVDGYSSQPGYPQISQSHSSQGTQGGQGQGPYGSYVQQQPGAHSGMSIGTQVPYSTAEPGKWSSGLFGCSFGGYCFACWCPCVGLNEQRIEHILEHRHPARKEELSWCSGDCVFIVLAEHFGLGWILETIQRGKARGHFRIKGNCCTDCLTVSFCSACAAAQESRELTREENHMWAQTGHGPGGQGPVVEGQFATPKQGSYSNGVAHGEK